MKKKKFSFKNMSVRGKLIMLTSITVILMIIVAGSGLFTSIRTNKARSNRYDVYAMGRFYLSEAYGDFSDIKLQLACILYVYDNPEQMQASLDTMNAYEELVEKNLETFQKIEFSPEIEAEYALVEAKVKEFIASANACAEQALNGHVEEARVELLTTGMPLAEEVEDDMAKITSLVANAADDNERYVQLELNVMIIILMVASVLAVFISIIYSLTLIRSITVPVRKLSQAAKKLAAGDVDVDCEKMYDDDLGQLMDDFSEMARATENQVHIAEVIAQGDLTVDVQPRSDRDVLGHALRKLVNDQNITLNNIKESGAQIAVGSEQVANASQALAQGATEQASAIEEVTASMDEVTQRTKNNATEAGEANTLVNTIKNKAAEGNDQMKSMIEAMDSINESSETISKIIKTIDDIAFQTNILALNAAVEAARAGVHGKGFAVVAEEVRNLAAKSASAASETAEMIEDSIRKIANGTKLAEETASSLDEIVGSIDEIVGLISSITVSSSDQATAISQIDQAISQVSTVVQTNAATSEQAAAASEQLSNQAATLKSLIGQYKLLALGQSSNISFGDSMDSSYEDGEQIISLEGDFSKY